MVQRAVAEGTSDRLGFSVGDLRDWRPGEPVDVLVSNATLQWVPDHLALLPSLVEAVAAGRMVRLPGPGQLRRPQPHLDGRGGDLRRGGSERFDGRDRARPAVEQPAAYLDRLAGLGCAVDAWESTYLHVLRGPDAVVRWVSGTGLRPYLQVLTDDDERDAFVADYRALVAVAYPEEPWGTVLPFRRIFVVAQRAVQS